MRVHSAKTRSCKKWRKHRKRYKVNSFHNAAHNLPMTSFPGCEHRKHMDPWSRKHILVWWSANKKQIIVYNSILIKTSKYKIHVKTFILRLSLVAATIFLIRFKNNRPHELRNSNEYNFVQTYNYLSFIEVIPWKLHSYLFKSLVLNP